MNVPDNFYNCLVAFFSGHSNCTVYCGQTSTFQSITTSTIQGSDDTYNSLFRPATFTQVCWLRSTILRCGHKQPNTHPGKIERNYFHTRSRTVKCPTASTIWNCTCHAPQDPRRHPMFSVLRVLLPTECVTLPYTPFSGQ